MKIENIEEMSDLQFESYLKKQCKFRKRKQRNELEFEQELERMINDEELQILYRL